MRRTHRSQLRVVLVTAIVSGMLILAQPRQADAYLQVIPVFLAYFTVMAPVCTPVAAVKASDYPGGFSGAFKDCMSLNLKERHPLLTEGNQSSGSTEAEVVESKDRFDD